MLDNMGGSKAFCVGISPCWGDYVFGFNNLQANFDLGPFSASVRLKRP